MNDDGKAEKGRNEGRKKRGNRKDIIWVGTGTVVQIIAKRVFKAFAWIQYNLV